MRLNPRFALPAALVSVALAVPAGTAVADHQPNHQANRSCPNNTDWTTYPAALAPQDKDKNRDGLVCKKIASLLEDNPTKDNNNPDNFVDNEFPDITDVVEEILPLP
ncbi:MAG: hypothetical protein M3340_11455 [Actinomycetota bacterium]|nr:hypothetical protein [Actinomycetota bacterium]